MKTTVVNRHYQEFDVDISRTSKWGNPFVIGRDGTRIEVITKYLAHLERHPELLAALHELRGLRLGCWCKPRDCHGDILAELADSLATPHKWHECHCGECYFCRSELTCCDVCGGFEGTLTTDCCGRRLTQEEENRIYNLADLDFRSGMWFSLPNWSRSQKDGTFKCMDGIIRTRDEFIVWLESHDG